MKKLAAIVGVFFALIIGAMVIIPLVVDVDKYRPDIVKAANEKLNGTLELGKLSMSLWGKIHVGIDGLKLKDSQGRSLVSVTDAAFNLPYTSIFSGAPLVTLSMKQPEINVIKSKDGKINLMSLMKESAPAAGTGGAAEATQAKTVGGADAQQVALPAMVVNAHLGIFIEKAKLLYKDESMALTSTVDDFNFRVKDFSLSRKTEMELWADLKTTMGSDLVVEGPLKLIAELTPEIGGGEFKSAKVVANFTADDLEIKKGGLFHKAKGVPAHFKFDGTLNQEALNLKEATAVFHNAEITVSGEFHKLNGANIVFKSKPVDLKSWSDLIPMLKEYELSGKLDLDGYVKGKPEALVYQASLGVKDLSAKGPNLKAKPVINGEIVIMPDRVEKLAFDLKGPGNDIKLNAKVNSFSKPQIQFTVTSPTGMDLDQWIEFPKKADAPKAAAASKDAGKESAKSSGGAPEADYDAMLDTLRKNETAKAMAVDGSVNIAFMKMMNVRMDNMVAKVQFKNLVAALTGMSLKIFGGSVSGSFTTDLKPAHPDYNMKLSIAGLDMSKAVESQFQSFKNTLSGKLTSTVEGGGKSFNPASAKKNLLMKGNFKLADAQFKSLDIAKTVNEAINSSVGKMGDKIPGLKGKKVSVPANVDSHYELVSSSFTIKDGFLDAPDFTAKPSPKRGVELKGSTRMGLVDESLNAKWEVIDSQHVTGSDQVNVDIAGKAIKNVLAKGEKDPVILPLSVGCKWSDPCPNYSEVPAYLLGVAMGRVSKGAGEAVKQKAIDTIKQKAGGEIGNSLKKLFGH